MNSYDVGDVVTLTATFKDSAGVLADPETVTLKVRHGATSTTYTTDLVRDSVGVYHYDLTLTASGVWSYRWEGSASPKTAEESRLFVRASAV